jgi:hypothetical protein
MPSPDPKPDLRIESHSEKLPISEWEFYKSPVFSTNFIEGQGNSAEK